MKLSDYLISQFVKITNDRVKKKTETTLYGTTEKDSSGRICVRLDGSDLLTPVSNTANIGPNERVMVLIKNHTAIVTGNLTAPAARCTLDENNNVVRVENVDVNGIENLTKTVSEQGTKISVVQNQIATKIWQKDIDVAVEDIITSTDTLTEQYSELVQSVGGLSSTVASHTTQISGKAEKSAVAALEQNLTGFKTTVSETYSTKNEVSGVTQRVSTIEQTVNGLSVSIDDAAKTATNFMSYDSTNGLQIGNKTSGSWSGFRTRITATTFDILNSAGTVLASYGAKLIELGKGAADAVISFCGGKGRIEYDADEDYLQVTGDKIRLKGDSMASVYSTKVQDTLAQKTAVNVSPDRVHVYSQECSNYDPGDGSRINYNLLKPSKVSYSSRLQDDIEGITSSTAGNAVTDWIPVQYGKYYTGSSFYNDKRGVARFSPVRMNLKRQDGSIVVYNKNTVPVEPVENSRKAIKIEYEDAVAIRLHFSINNATGVGDDISSPNKLKEFKPMIVEGDTAEQSYYRALTYEYLDGDEDLSPQGNVWVTSELAIGPDGITEVADNITEVSRYGSSYESVSGDIDFVAQNGDIKVNGMSIARNKILWSGGYYMQASQTITLSEAISAQANGIILIFSGYTPASETINDFHWSTHFVPKEQISHYGGGGHSFIMSGAGNFESFAAKYLYISDTSIKGHDNNKATGTGACGIKYTNNAYVLRYVIGV